MQEEQGVIVRTTRGQIEDIVDSIFWKDIERELETWKKGFELEMHSIVEEAATTNPSTAAVLMHMGDLNGRIKAVNYLLNLPTMFLDLLEDQENGTRHKRTD